MSLITYAAEFIPETGNDVSADPIPGESRISRVMNRIANRKSTPKRPPSVSMDKYGDFSRPQNVSEPMTNITPIDNSDEMEFGDFNNAPAISSAKPSPSSPGSGGATHSDVGNGGFRYNTSLGFPGELDDAYAADVPVSTNSNHGTTSMSTPILQSNDTIKKLDYLIHMIEEQRDHKTGRVAEELVLYSFLGVFVIFTIDSFVKVGKYTR